MDTTNTLQLGALLMGLFGGLALFLFGMELMTDALKIVAGGGMKRLLESLTTNRFKASFAGALVTAVIQSSSVTTVLVVGFISAGLMTLSQSIGIIMGANIGTTITAQIIAFKVTHYALVLVALGYGASFVFKDKKRIQYGYMVMGLGLIFFGMQVMSSATKPLRSYQPFIDLMKNMESPFLGILISAAFTGLVQSSSATTGVIIVLAAQGFITLEAGIALAFGANIGTCVTALLASIGKPRAAVQAALVHVLFNVLGVLLWLGFIDQLAALVRSMSPAGEGLEGAARLAAETPRQIANAHTVFNIANTLLFIWFTTPMAKLVQFLVPEKKEAEPTQMRSKYLDDILLQTPALALEFTRLELCRLGQHTQRMVEKALPTFFEGDEDELKALARMDDEVDQLYEILIRYLGSMSQSEILEEQSVRLRAYIDIANYFENIGDMIETNVVQVGLEKLEAGAEVSAGTQVVLSELYKHVGATVAQVVEALVDQSATKAKAVIAAKGDIARLADEATDHLSERLTSADPNRMALFRMESEIVEYLRRVYYFAKRIAKAEVELGWENGDGLTPPAEPPAPDTPAADAPVEA